jgi:hypothetical protein
MKLISEKTVVYTLTNVTYPFFFYLKTRKYHLAKHLLIICTRKFLEM